MDQSCHCDSSLCKWVMPQGNAVCTFLRIRHLMNVVGLQEAPCCQITRVQRHHLDQIRATKWVQILLGLQCDVKWRHNAM